MKTVLRPRYYCDFCKKSGGGSHAMKTHEAHCTNNPNRDCRMCALLGGGDDLPELIKVALTGNVGALREAANGCAPCMLAAIRQVPWPLHLDDFSGTSWPKRPKEIDDWKFKDESACAMERVNEMMAEERG